MNRKNEEIFPEFEYIDQNYGKIRQSSVFSCNNNLAYNDFMQHFIMSSIKLLNCNFSKQKREQFHNQEGWSTPIFRSLSVPEHANVKTRMLFGTMQVYTVCVSTLPTYYQRLIAIVVKRRVIIIGNQVIMVIRSIVPPVI